MKTERIVINVRDEEKIKETINAFIDAGWLYTNISNHGAGVILRFDWTDEVPPVYPNR